MSFPLSLSQSSSPTELRGQMPPSQTSSIERKSTAQSRSQPASKASADKMPEEANISPSSPPTGHLRFVLTDIVAARYIEEDPSTTCEVLARRQRIEGYEIYLVEQWACSRSHPTFLITTYTGNAEDVVLATIISVPADEEKWSPQMRLYFSSLTEYHARRKETPYGVLMITSLSGFPSSLTVIPIPGGDLKQYRESFFVNENLKRLGCSGRLGIKLAPPSSATQAKFHQLYRTSEKIPFNASVIELVKLCQVALVLFDKLEPEYADGLLCDVTEKAINDWWIELGAEYYTVEPHDGILGPTTVAALLGMLMGARNRLGACSSAVAKDVFDIESTKRGIAHFQKSHHLPRTRRLDRQTLDKLRRATAKAASKEGWAVPRAFKSTMTELGGKGGEMVMGIVGAGQKDGIAEVETVDIDRFVELARGEHARWLWHGKPRKSSSGDMFDRLPGEERSISPDKNNHAIKPLRRETTLEQDRTIKREPTSDELTKHEIFTPDGLEKDKDPKDAFSKRAVIKAKLESGSGFHHIKNAVSLRTHASKLSREEHGRHGLHQTKSSIKSLQYMDNNSTQTSVDQAHHSNDPSFVMSPQPMPTGTFAKTLTETPRDSASTLAVDRTTGSHHDHLEPLALNISVAESDASTQPPTAVSSIAGSIYHGVDLNENLPVEEVHEVPLLLRRTHSADQFHFYHASRNDAWWPRHLSLSIAEESVLRWTSITAGDVDEEAIEEDDTTAITLTNRMVVHNMQSEQLKRLHHRLALLSSTDTTWVSSRLKEIKELESSADADIETLDSIYFPHLDTYHALREDTQGVVSNNRSQLTESLRELGNVGDKLEYEINALKSKVEDVEDALGEFERQVEFVEHRVEELNRVMGQREGWWHWLIRMSIGIGKPPG
ncbi:uncharacterized protein K460DRAFT_362188 [Cucurbitaria berberidis CBS 394.84]|uniref:STB6-like N-terminal domain-containing protein n=1 Tax=Cucurbitaria berberidis CBS 394.84 TaxID=1168544 RepID=A0A9P4GTI0_9PLEO|nr:uncharacterized protein K460DRAFT_362188 [Cucurbitaria berberidis CBS 394.84]KAF1851445.1 hypothetical protein K460DRAFT_362188 [Cucurbitaria berberidis CBS 394.84]